MTITSFFTNSSNKFCLENNLLQQMFFKQSKDAEDLVYYVNLKFKKFDDRETYYVLYNRKQMTITNSFIDLLKHNTDDVTAIEYLIDGNIVITKHIKFDTFSCCLIYDNFNTILVFNDFQKILDYSSNL